MIEGVLLLLRFVLLGRTTLSPVSRADFSTLSHGDRLLDSLRVSTLLPLSMFPTSTVSTYFFNRRILAEKLPEVNTKKHMLVDVWDTQKGPGTEHPSPQAYEPCGHAIRFMAEA